MSSGCDLFLRSWSQIQIYTTDFVFYETNTVYISQIIHPPPRRVLPALMFCTVSLCVLQMLGRWLYIGGSSDLPGSRSLGRLLTSVWLDITATTQRNILSIIQTQRM